LLQVRVLPDPPAYDLVFLMGDWIQKLQDGVRHGTEFVQEAWQELKKVHWPARKETYAATMVVIVVVLLISAYLAVVDMALTKAVQAIIG
jgi:preprotein translocase subunit SecE